MTDYQDRPRQRFPDQNYYVDYLFPTQLYVEERVNNYDAIQEEISNYLNNIEWQWTRGWDSHWLSSTDFKDNPLTSLPQFSQQIGFALENYCNKMNFYENTGASMQASWFSKFEKHNYAHIHSHRAADISGVYYFKTSGDDGDLFFTSPIANAKASKAWANERHNIPPKQGCLLLFPGWFEHGVSTNTKEDARISFSFNIEVTELSTMPGSDGSLRLTNQ
tara:strand:- start:5267 stop:5926 length:660 start_codon:yes stop_codon:yes gene_type:complete